MEWNKNVNDKKQNGSYLVLIKTTSSYHYHILWWNNNLYTVDNYDFNGCKGKSGWYDYDSEWGYFEVDNVYAYTKLPDVKEIVNE